MGYLLPANNLQNVVPGATAVLKLPVGPTYDKIHLEFGGGMLPQHVLTIVGKINGRIFFSDTMLNNLARQSYRGITTSNGQATIDFTEPKARGGAVEQLLASIPSALVQDLSFELAIDPNAPQGGTIKAWTESRPPTTNPLIRKLLDTFQAFPAAGTQVMFLPVGNAGGVVKRIYIHGTSQNGQPGNTVQSLELRMMNAVMIDVTAARLQAMQTENNLVPQPGVLVLDFMVDGNLNGALNTAKANQLELRLNTSAADSYRVFTEYLDPIGRL
ncbi:TPA: major capsid protein P2 [Burkholderia cepacia]